MIIQTPQAWHSDKLPIGGPDSAGVKALVNFMCTSGDDLGFQGEKRGRENFTPSGRGGASKFRVIQKQNVLCTSMLLIDRCCPC